MFDILSRHGQSGQVDQTYGCVRSAAPDAFGRQSWSLDPYWSQPNSGWPSVRSCSGAFSLCAEEARA